MPKADVGEWTVEGVLDELARIHRSMKDRQFAFILGAGASFTSGIPTGHHLAQRWLTDLHLRECVDGRPLNEWIADCGIGSGSLTWETAAEHYPEVFERRFDGDREAGYAELEAAMEGKSPSLGYSLLAEIIQHTRHKVVVTTNFDNLVADALAMHAHQSPLVVAHESLAGFVRPQLRRPLVAKIHRDLFLNPINDTAGVSRMELGWKIALKKLFQYFTPVVVGYGGNDGSLMDMLAGLEPGDIAGRMVWCYREGSPPPAKAQAVLRKHRGLMVKIAGFDEFMLQLAAKLVNNFDVGAIAERTAELGQERATRYREQAQKLRETSARGTPAEQKAGAVLTESVRAGSSWWAWELRAQAALDIDSRENVYKEGLQNFPRSAELTSNYANFLAEQRKDYDSANAFYKDALELGIGDPNIIGVYAVFLASHRKDYDGAELMFKKALEIDASHVNNIGNYALFLKNQRKDYEGAETLFKQALEIEPNHSNNTDNYATFLVKQRKDYDGAEALFKRALEINPNNAKAIANYALFLSSQRKDYDQAESLYRKALDLDPANANNIGNYANLLARQRGDYDGAELLYKSAIASDPRHANNIGNYALFLESLRKDYDGAEALYKKAIEIDPGHANNIGNYAAFLVKHREDLDSAESYFKKALELDPSHANNMGNYALFLESKRNDSDGAEEFYKSALEIDASSASIIGNYALFLEHKRKDFDRAEVLFKKALELDPNHDNNTENFARFLEVERSDYDGAEGLYRKAVELDPAEPRYAANLALFLDIRRNNYDGAEVLYKTALDLAPNIANVFGLYANFLTNRRNDWGGAEALYKRAIEIDPGDANIYFNYSAMLLARGGSSSLDVVLGLVHRAFDLARPTVTQGVAEGLLYVSLVHELQSSKMESSALARLKGAIMTGYEREEWDFSVVLSSVLPRLSVSRRLMFQALADAILDADSVSILKSFNDWNELQAMEPFAP